MAKGQFTPIDLTGQRFGRLTVLRAAPGRYQRGMIWACLCDCGTEKVVAATFLKIGATRSCGCLRRECHTTHNMSHSREYLAYNHMRNRCNDPTYPEFHFYGGRGIRVCPEWEGDFAAFYRDMGPKPTPRHSIDRIDNDGNYEPGNCRWATPKEQTRNRRTTRMVTFGGETRPLAEWAEITGLGYGALSRRLDLGWKPEHALTFPLYRGRSRNKPAP